MASAYDQNIGTELITTGEQAGLWGITTNNNFTNVFGQALYGSGTLTMAADADEAFQVPQNVAVLNAIRAASLTIASAVPLTLQRTVTLRSPIAAGISKFYSLKNGTTGGQTIVVRTTPGGTGLLIPNGKRVLLKLDGVNAEEQFDYSPSLSGSLLGFRNLVINGDIGIDQRREGGLSGAIGVSPNEAFGPDRWNVGGAGTAQYTVQRIFGGGPPGFPYYCRVTITVQDPVLGVGENALVIHRIDGRTVLASLGWGTAWAKPAMLSFWVRSNIVTGQFGGVMRGDTAVRNYPFLYTVNAANVWEYKTVPIPAELTGAWPNGSTQALQVIFSMGAAAASLGAPGAWQAASFFGATGQVSILANASTFDFTGVQLESGTVATPFEVLPQTQAMQRCQRYYWKTHPEGTPATFNTGMVGCFTFLSLVGGAANGGNIRLPVMMARAPTLTAWNPLAANNNARDLSGGADIGVVTFSGAIAGTTGFHWNCGNIAVGNSGGFHITADAEI